VPALSSAEVGSSGCTCAEDPKGTKILLVPDPEVDAAPGCAGAATAGSGPVVGADPGTAGCCLVELVRCAPPSTNSEED
jgi:hypothetical protein